MKGRTQVQMQVGGRRVPTPQKGGRPCAPSLLSPSPISSSRFSTTPAVLQPNRTHQPCLRPSRVRPSSRPFLLLLDALTRFNHFRHLRHPPSHPHQMPPTTSYVFPSFPLRRGPLSDVCSLPQSETVQGTMDSASKEGNKSIAKVHSSSDWLGPDGEIDVVDRSCSSSALLYTGPQPGSRCASQRGRSGRWVSSPLSEISFRSMLIVFLISFLISSDKLSEEAHGVCCLC